MMIIHQAEKTTPSVSINCLRPKKKNLTMATYLNRHYLSKIGSLNYLKLFWVVKSDILFLLMMFLTIPTILMAEIAMEAEYDMTKFEFVLFNTDYIKKNEEAIIQHMLKAPNHRKIDNQEMFFYEVYFLKYNVVEDWDKIIKTKCFIEELLLYCKINKNNLLRMKEVCISTQIVVIDFIDDCVSGFNKLESALLENVTATGISSNKNANNIEFQIKDNNHELNVDSVNNNITLLNNILVYAEEELLNPLSLWNMNHENATKTRLCDSSLSFLKLSNLKECEIYGAFDILSKLSLLFWKTELILQHDRFFDSLNSIESCQINSLLEEKCHGVFEKIYILLSQYQNKIEYGVEERCKNIRKSIYTIYSRQNIYLNMNDTLRSCFLKRYISFMVTGDIYKHSAQYFILLAMNCFYPEIHDPKLHAVLTENIRENMDISLLKMPFVTYLKKLGGKDSNFSLGIRKTEHETMSYKEKLKFFENNYNNNSLPKSFPKYMYYLAERMELKFDLIDENGSINFQSNYILQCLNILFNNYKANVKNGVVKKQNNDNARSEMFIYMLDYFVMFLDRNIREILNDGCTRDGYIYSYYKWINNECLFSCMEFSLKVLASKIAKLDDQRETRMAVFFFDAISLFTALGDYWGCDTKLSIKKLAQLRQLLVKELSDQIDKDNLD